MPKRAEFLKPVFLLVVNGIYLALERSFDSTSVLPDIWVKGNSKKHIRVGSFLSEILGGTNLPDANSAELDGKTAIDFHGL